MGLSDLKSRIARLRASLDDEEKERPSRATAWIVVALAFLLLPFLWTPWIHGNDGVRNYAYCRSPWIDGDLDFTDEFKHYRAEGEIQFPPSSDPVTGRPGNPLGIGMGILWSPFFLLAHMAAKIGPWEADGYSAPYAWAVCLGSTLYAIAGLFLLTRVLSWRFDSRSALTGVVAVWLGSPLVFYMYLHPSMSHAGSFFWCSLLVWEYEHWRQHPSRRHFFLIGLTVGLAAATRYDNAIYLLLPAAFWARSRWASLYSPVRRPGAGRSAMGALALIGIGLCVGFLPQMAAWHSMYGSWFAGPRDYDLATNLAIWKSPNLMAVLLSGHRGLFVWSPVLLIATVGFVRLVTRRRLLDSALAAGLAIQLWIIGGWAVWWGGASFGQRFFIHCTPAFALGLACLVRDIRFAPFHRLIAALIVLCLLWSAGLGVQYVGGLIDREEPVSFGRLVANQFCAVPAWIVNHAGLLLPGATRAPTSTTEEAVP
ncbi:hypothetical protein JW916_04035 [Candidatus Sumerlaeota bacterium]|nr:hypothetical protein [Candidatus Sumerlaeota bacterium]